MQINLHVTVGNPSPEHVVHSWMWANKLAEHSNRLNLHILDLGINNISKIVDECKTYNSNVTCTTITDQKSGSSERHALGLSLALQSITKESTDINILADSDCYTVIKGWDTLIEYILSITNCIGTTYEPIGGFSSGNGIEQTYKNIPNLTWIALAPGFDWNELDPSPDLFHRKSFSSPEEAQLHNLPEGSKLVRDVGWKIPRFLHDKHLSYIALTHVKPSGTSKILKGLSDYHEQYNLAREPILAHQRGASKHRFSEGKLSEGFIKAIDKWNDYQSEQGYSDWTQYSAWWTRLSHYR